MKLKTEQEYDKAVEIINGLLKKELDTFDEIYLDALTDAVEEYQDEMFEPLGEPTAQEYLLAIMEEYDMVKKDLIPYFGSKQRVYEFFKGNSPSKDTIARLVQGLNIPANIFFNSTNYHIDLEEA
ncbi:hypothetical protein [Persicobacter psychrovividus]|uniref:Transcriptional regulator n=1 Tax=Persicobacter psychrovividus TaxID=387638 RepID=A0ABM7VN52_9BACT|nr:hypothetical protein PEPS_47250 [Persicobacter psychrovividus]